MLGKRWVVNVAGILLMGNHFFISELEFIGRCTFHSSQWDRNTFEANNAGTSILKPSENQKKNQCITNKRIKAIKVCVIAKIALNDTNYEIWMHAGQNILWE